MYQKMERGIDWAKVSSATAATESRPLNSVVELGKGTTVVTLITNALVNKIQFTN